MEYKILNMNLNNDVRIFKYKGYRIPENNFDYYLIDVDTYELDFYKDCSRTTSWKFENNEELVRVSNLFDKFYNIVDLEFEETNK